MAVLAFIKHLLTKNLFVICTSRNILNSEKLNSSILFAFFQYEEIRLLQLDVKLNKLAMFSLCRQTQLDASIMASWGITEAKFAHEYSKQQLEIILNM